MQHSGRIEYMHYKQLSIEEREFIQLALWEKKPVRQIAKELNRNVSTVSREISKNISGRNIYTPRAANSRALVNRKSRGRKNRLKSSLIREYVITHLKQRWSPEQIAGRIRIDYPGLVISHEAIYQFIYHQIHQDGWGYLKPGCQDLRMYLRRRKKRRTHKGMRRCQRVLRPKGTSINQRPSIINERERIGDWESDTVESCVRKPGINTLVERTIGIVFITKLKNRDSQAMVKAVDSRMLELPRNLKQSLTMDNGPENSDWPELEKRTGMKCYYANAYHSWERGSNENANGLIRDYYPKKTDFTTVPEEELKQVEFLLNTRPRKRLSWLTPLEVFSKSLNQFNISINMPSVALVG